MKKLKKVINNIKIFYLKDIKKYNYYTISEGNKILYYNFYK